MIYIEMTESQMIDSLMSDDNAKWTYDQADMLVDYYESLSEETQNDIRWDRVAIRCEWSAYDDIEDVKKAYDSIDSMEDLEDNTTVLECYDSTLLVMDF